MPRKPKYPDSPVSIVVVDQPMAAAIRQYHAEFGLASDNAAGNQLISLGLSRVYPSTPPFVPSRRGPKPRLSPAAKRAVGKGLGRQLHAKAARAFVAAQEARRART